MRRDLLAVAQGGMPAAATAGYGSGAGAPYMTPSETAVMPAVGGGQGQAPRPAPRRRSNAVWPWVVVAILLIAAGIGAAYALGFIGFGVTVPSVTGLSQASAKEQIEAAQLTLGDVTEAFDEKVEKGSVIEQNPAAGTKVDKGSAVTLVVSKGREMVVVPDVTGLPELEAFKTLKEFGLDPQPGTPEFSKDVEQGTVIKQDPVAGDELPKGSAVTYVVSKGTQMAQVPSVVGKTEAEAVAALKAAGLKVAKKTGYSDTVAKGKVMAQTPDGGVSIATGGTVTITVVDGTLTVQVPDLHGLTEDQAKAQLATLGLKASVTPSPGATLGQVVDQSPLPGQDVKRGDTVNISVGTAP
jgi:serine/threonine-protein kinase